MAVAVCIAQDLAVVPMILTLPLLAGGAEGGVVGALGEVGVSLGLFAALAVLAWLTVPRVLDIVARTRSRELFLLAVLASCLAIALVTSVLGLSLALGAFLAGVVLGSSDHHHQAVAEVEPFRDALASLFFVSIGMLFDPRAFVDEPLVVAVVLVAVLVGKAGIAALAIRLTRMPWWTAARSGLMLAQVGEFSFVIAQLGATQGLLTERTSRIFLVVAVLSIALTPALFAVGRRIGRLRSDPSKARPGLEGHVVIVGYGPIGQGLVGSLRTLGIPFRIVELNGDTVQREKKAGLPIVRGDAGRRSVLEAVGIRRARMLVVATNEPSANQKVVGLARRMAPHLHVLTRASYLAEVPALEEAGADEIVPQELETGVEMVARTLRHFLLPDSEVEAHVERMRAQAYAIRKVAPRQGGTTARLSQYVPGLRVATFRVEPGAPIAGRTLGDSHLRRDTGLSVVSVARGGETILSVGPETALEADDVVVGIGTVDAARAAAALFRGPG
jgi:CPA2 family monovalent cation:H+ antiporter-2